MRGRGKVDFELVFPIAFLCGLTLTLGILKGVGIIGWPWSWIFAPIWIPFSLLGLAVLAVVIILTDASKKL